jgi:hypothetical protein
VSQAARERAFGEAIDMFLLASSQVALGGLLVIVLATGPQSSRVETRQGRRIFKGDKNP